MPMEAGQKRGRLWLAGILVIAALAGAALLLWYAMRPAEAVPAAPQETSVLCQNNDAEAGARDWLAAYLGQYQQSALPHRQKLDDWGISHIGANGRADAPLVECSFWVRPATRLSEEFLYWGVVDGEEVYCDWTIQFEVTDEGNGYRFRYVEQRLYQEEPVLYLGQPGMYTIEDERVFVHYEDGSSAEVPVPLHELVQTFDGNPVYNQLAEGSYLISAAKTAFLYGGGPEVPLQLVYSDDAGASWGYAEVAPAGFSCRTRHISFPQGDTGYAVISGERTMRQELTGIYRTDDGGASWAPVGEGPATRMLAAAVFVAPELGFFSYENGVYEDGRLLEAFYRTADGGQSFTVPHLPLPPAPEGWEEEYWRQVFVSPGAPCWEEGQLVLLVGQGEDGDYEGGQVCAKYRSGDLGLSWEYVGTEMPPEVVGEAG